MAKYSKKIVSRICDLVREDSYTIPEICSIVGISESTYHEWKATKVEFSEALKEAQDKFTENMLVECNRSLVKLIKGYTAEESRVVYVESKSKEVDEDGNIIKSKPKIKEQVVTKKHVAPSLGAIIHFQTNRDPDTWKNRQETKVNADVAIKSHLENLSDEELIRIAEGKSIDGKIE